MTIKVRMVPHVDDYGKEESGIRRCIESYFRHLPKFDIELVGIDTKREDFDLLAVHAGSYDGPTDICHCHGLYFSADYETAAWEWRTNMRVINSIRQAKETTVPSSWVAEVFQRDMRFTPHIIPHGIDWDAWQGIRDNRGHILFNKNRAADVCDPEPVRELALRFPNEVFVSTFKLWDIENIQDTGVIPFPEMREYVMSAGVYLSSTKETFGIGTLEALASGVPVLGFAHGGNLIMVEHGVNGYLAKVGDYDDLAEGLHYCLKHRKVLSDNARESAKRFPWEAACEKVAEVYRLALEPDPPTVSIVIPSFNYADKVGRAIESAVNQTYSQLVNIIIVDDGSTDEGETERVVRGWTARDGRVAYHRIENSGVANARNYGISLSDTRFIACLDADDAMETRLVETCIRELESDRSLGIAYTGLRAYEKGGSGIGRWPGEFDYDEQLRRKNQVPTCCVFKRDAWERVGGFRQRYAPEGAGSEDAAYWTVIGSIGYGAKLADPFPKFLNLYHNFKDQAKREPEKKDLVGKGITEPEYDLAMASLFDYYIGEGTVTGDKNYREVDWLAWYPFAHDGQHPFASVATPKHKWSHPVRQYDEPLVSVIIPVGPGHEDEVFNALDSLDAQTFRKWEAIVVWDNIGWDGEIVHGLEKAYPYVKWIHNKGVKGAGYARNRGAEIARGSFLVFLDADDWLYPDALERMLQAWQLDGAIVYTDYVGKAIISVEHKEKLEKVGRLKYFRQTGENEGEAVIAHRSNDYDPNLAQNQPKYTGKKDMPFYVFSLVTCLIPKAWHDEIGGYDESMVSWEDVDYHWRMAKAGKCYVRLAEELMVYRFYTGKRREKGLHAFPKIVEYLRAKYEEIEIMGCNCGNGRSTLATKSQVAPSLSGAGNRRISGAAATRPAQSTGGTTKMNDRDFVKVKYMHPNKGKHEVMGSHPFPAPIDGLNMKNLGAGFHINYGFRGGGSVFTIHRNDMIMQAHLFQEIQEIPSGAVFNPPQPPTQTMPAPQPIVRDVRIPPAPTRASEPLSAPPPVTPVNLHKLPGMTKEIAVQFQRDGVINKESFLELNVKGLMKYKGVGEKKAKKFIEAVS